MFNYLANRTRFRKIAIFILPFLEVICFFSLGYGLYLALLVSPADYQTDLTVEQLDRDDTVLKSYIFRNAFPLNISAIDLSSAEVTEIETFEIEWRYQHFEPSGVSF